MRKGEGPKRKLRKVRDTPSRQFRWSAQPHLHGPFIGEVLVFLLFKGDVAALTTGIDEMV